MLTAVVQLLHEVGYEGLTMDAVAGRARCGKATLYRQWQGKPRLVAAALHATRPDGFGEIDTGSLRGDLMAVLRALGAKAADETVLISGLARAMLDDKELARTLRDTLVAPQDAKLAAIVDRAVARGELPARPAATAWLGQLVFGTLLCRPLIQDEYADDAYLVRFLDEALIPALLHS
ncbi:TetR/AcrR family transcriptional regulator [Streptomyces avicenniae]|uniref:TetR/AcrR family transcriptional regulator n=1 Tax=Streptomyces avicenniae TaxID=500153 RepID=UPI000A71E46A|nr:TetR/AcrR family transcriptional regulator [Streptomyces avicenniae]